MISLEEKKYYSSGIISNCRYDGREVNSISILSLEKHSVLGSLGSATVFYVDSKFKINNTWKVNVKTLLKESNRNDRILCWDRSEWISHFIKSLMFENQVFKEGMSIKNSGYFWNLEINLSISQLGGSILDTCSYAIIASLSTVTLPSINAISQSEGYKLKLDKSDDEAISSLIKKIPLIITCGILNGVNVWSMCENEEKCVDTIIKFVINRNSEVVGIDGSGNMSIDINEYSNKAIELSKKIFDILNS